MFVIAHRANSLDREDGESTFLAMMKAITEPMIENKHIGEMQHWFQNNVVGYASDGANTGRKGCARPVARFGRKSKYFCHTLAKWRIGWNWCSVTQ